jgi:hypothetical protein
VPGAIFLGAIFSGPAHIKILRNKGEKQGKNTGDRRGHGGKERKRLTFFFIFCESSLAYTGGLLNLS